MKRGPMSGFAAGLGGYCVCPRCGSCRMVAPIIEELAEDYAGKILF